MNLDAYRLIRLSHAEIASARAAFARLRLEHGAQAGVALQELAREDETAYHTQRLSAGSFQDRVHLGKRLAAARMMEHWLANGFGADDNLFPELVTLGTQQTDPKEVAADQQLRRHIFAAMIDAVLEAKQQKGEDHDVATAVLAELSDLAGESGMTELRKMLHDAQHLGLEPAATYMLGLQVEQEVWLSHFVTPRVSGVQNLGWEVSGVSRRSGKTRWRNNVTGEYRYQEMEPGTRVRKQRSAEIAEHHMQNIHQQRDVLADHLDELGKHLPSMSVKQLRQWRGVLGAWRVKGGSLKEGMVKAIHEYAKGMVQQHHQREQAHNEIMGRAPEQPKGTQPLPPHPDESVVNNVDLKATPEQKVQQLVKMTAENKPRVDAFLKGLDAKFGTVSKSNIKLPERILEKSKRPSILAKKPWFDVEHIRDSFRFKTVLPDITKLPDVIQHMESELGAEVLKRDVDKFLQPLEWGWRIVAFDLKMPNGQMVEYYLPVKEMEDAKAHGHVIFERWRNKDLKTLSRAEKLAYKKDIDESRGHYQKAFDGYLARSGNTESAVRASLAKAAASPDEAAKNSSAVSDSGKANPSTQEPLTREAAKPSSSMTQARPSEAREPVADIGKPSTGIVPPVGSPSSSSPAAVPSSAKPLTREEKLAKIKGDRAKLKPSAGPSAADKLRAQNDVYQKHLQDVKAEASAGIEKSKAFMDKWKMSNPQDAWEREAKARMNAELNAPKSGPPAPDANTGIINPKPSGVPGIVSGAKEIPAKASEGGFDAAAWDKREKEIAQRVEESKKAGNRHLDGPNHVETTRGKTVRSIRDGSTGTVVTAFNDGSVLVDWADEESARQNNARPEKIKEGRKERTVWRNHILPSDAHEFVVEKPAAAPASTVAQPAGKHPIRDLYDRAGDTSIPSEKVEETLGQLDKMPKSELLPLAEEMELSGMKSRSATEIRKQIKMKVLDRRSGAQREGMIEDRGAEADAKNAAAMTREEKLAKIRSNLAAVRAGKV